MRESDIKILTQSACAYSAEQDGRLVLSRFSCTLDRITVGIACKDNTFSFQHLLVEGVIVQVVELHLDKNSLPCVT